MEGFLVAESARPVIQVAGDVTADWQLCVAANDSGSALHAAYFWETRGNVTLSARPGGAAMLTSLLTEAALGSFDIVGADLTTLAMVNPMDGEAAHSFALWQLHPKSAGSRDRVWRMASFLGIRPGDHVSAQTPSTPGDARCIVLDDANLGFRSDLEAWPEAIQTGSGTAQVVLKMASPFAEGPLWDELIARHSDRLTLYVALGDLRKSNVSIGQPLSWEQIASEIVSAITANKSFAQAARTVVSLGFGGAVLVEDSQQATLIFDPLHQEGDWERSRPGLPTGLGTSIVAALALELAANLESPNLAEAIARGLNAGRLVHEVGFASVDSPSPSLEFPYAAAAASLAERDVDHPFSIAHTREGDQWRLLPMASDREYQELAARIVVEGEDEACEGLPLERMGSWASVDRTEIESIRSLRSIVRQYLSQSKRVRPLNLAVFGPPGSGKSFAVKQMAREWSTAGTNVEILEFNVAQFASVRELGDALQRVRDATVNQSLPLVFWDEFDSAADGRELGWLSRFLAPMQDGQFLDGGISRPIGPAIFVFAGGTHSTLGSFKDRAVNVPGAKATDFLSRLRGHVDVLGPNRRDDSDLGHVLRRALLLRAVLLRFAPQFATGNQLNIDPGVLRAFLEVPVYLHGARSLEAIIEMSSLAGRLRYERSSLPARHQLALHVDAAAFLGLIDSTAD